jgi:hypothetical protein
MMSDGKLHLISLASWEDRFPEGTQRLIEQKSIASITLFYLDQYSDWSAGHRMDLLKFAKSRGVSTTEVELAFAKPAQVWTNSIVPALNAISVDEDVLVDVSTMPREIIWQVFWLLGRRGRNIHYVYHRPQGYGDWLSRDPGKPRLSFKMSGLSKLECRTALVVLAGYDVDRVQHLVATFEPAVTLLGLQKNSVDPQNSRKMREQKEAFDKDASVRVFEVDAYADDHGASAVKCAIAPFAGDHNILLTSMGPKLSAVALFSMHWQDESLGLVYLPANEFNLDYSHGIGESVFGCIPLVPNEFKNV